MGPAATAEDIFVVGDEIFLRGEISPAYVDGVGATPARVGDRIEEAGKTGRNGQEKTEKGFSHFSTPIA